MIHQAASGNTNTYLWSSSVTWKDNVNLEGEGESNTVNEMQGYHIDAINILQMKVSKLHFLGNDTGYCFKVGGQVGNNNNALCTWSDLYINHFATGFTPDSTGMYDTLLSNVQFYNNEIAYKFATTSDMLEFVRCQFRLNEVAAQLSGTSEQVPSFIGCSFSGNDYDFDIATLTGGDKTPFNVINCWFENEGAATLGGAGNGNVFYTSGKSAIDIRPILFTGCRFGATSPIDLAWISAGALYRVGFYHCNWFNVDTFPSVAITTEDSFATVPNFLGCMYQDTTAGKHNIWMCNNLLSDTFAVDSTGVKTLTITHGMIVKPLLRDCSIHIVKDTDVEDWVTGWMAVTASSTTTVTVKVRVDVASATANATAKVGLSISKVR